MCLGDSSTTGDFIPQSGPYFFTSDVNLCDLFLLRFKCCGCSTLHSSDLPVCQICEVMHVRKHKGIPGTGLRGGEHLKMNCCNSAAEISKPHKAKLVTSYVEFSVFW